MARGQLFGSQRVDRWHHIKNHSSFFGNTSQNSTSHISLSTLIMGTVKKFIGFFKSLSLKNTSIPTGS